MELFNKVKQILFDSEKFFSNLNKEKTIQDSLLFYIILLAINTLLGFFISLIFGNFFIKFVYDMFNLNFPLPEIAALKLFGQTILGYVLTILFSFLIAGMLYVWLLIFKGEKGYPKTYQLYVYSHTPSYVFGWIPFLNFFAWIYSFILMIIGTKKIYNFSTLKSVLIYLIPLILSIILGMFLFAIWTAILSLAKLT